MASVAMPFLIYGRPSLCKDFLIVRGSVSAAAIYPAWAMMFSPGLGEIRPSTSHHIIELEVP
jgi:hypothetical protein